MVYSLHSIISMPYSSSSFRFNKLNTKDKKKAIIQARISARTERWITYVDVVERRLLNAREAEELKMDSIEYAIVGRFEIKPNGTVTEL